MGGVAIISDIHSNLAALEAVLADIDSHRISQIACLGDIVNYGARPKECLALVRERCRWILGGNHELHVCGGERGKMRLYKADIISAARWTRKQLTDDEADYLLGLDCSMIIRVSGQEVFLAHGIPSVSEHDQRFTYLDLDTFSRALKGLRTQQTRFGICGHTHYPICFEHQDNPEIPKDKRVKFTKFWPDTPFTEMPETVAEYSVTIRDGAFYVFNPGSVGQPRDQADPRAAYGILDLDKKKYVAKRVPYDIERTMREIKKAGLPKQFAYRLRHAR